MKRLITTNACLLGLLSVLAAACGSEEKPAAETTTPDEEGETTGADTSEAPEETTSDMETDSTPPPSPGGVGDPVLEEVPPETELSELDEDQLAEVCEAYVKTSNAVSANLGELCPAQGLFQATQSADVTDDESYQAECAAQVEACEEQVATASEETPEMRCESAGQCGASVQDFNDCNAQIAALNEYVLGPLSNQQVTECSETTQAQANNQALLLGLTFAAGLTTVEQEAGGSPTDADGPCARISEACPELGVALGAFSELGEQLP